MSQESPPTARAWAEIHAAALLQNISLLRQQFAPARLMAVVKADAYGHNMALVAPLAAQAGVTEFGVATVAEGIALRSLLPDVQVFLIALTLPEEAEAIVAHRLIPFISTAEMGAALAEAGQRQRQTAEAHLEVNTGIGRAGVGLTKVFSLLRALDDLRGLHVTGLVTHFAAADEDLADAQLQHTLFLNLLAELGPRAKTLLIHAANSPAAFLVPSARHQLIRPGLLLYGIEPMPSLFSDQRQALQPVLSLKARVLLCQSLHAGETISYGRTYSVPSGGGVYATLGIGYGDGFPRRLSNQGTVLLQGRHAPIRGRVCMDQLVVDVTEIPGVRVGDAATIIGAEGTEQIRAADLAGQIGTTPHEITTCLTARIPRLLSRPFPPDDSKDGRGNLPG